MCVCVWVCVLPTVETPSVDEADLSSEERGSLVINPLASSSSRGASPSTDAWMGRGGSGSEERPASVVRTDNDAPAPGAPRNHPRRRSRDSEASASGGVGLRPLLPSPSDRVEGTEEERRRRSAASPLSISER